MPQPDDESESSAAESPDVTMVDPRAPRFGQTITMSALLLGIGLQEPLFVLAVAVILNAAILSGWRLTPYSFVWRHVVIPVVGKPEQPEPAAPHRFAKLMGASMSTVATILLFGAPVVNLPMLALLGYAVALVHAGAAALGGIGDFCVGCRMYKQVGFFRRRGVI